MHLKETLGSDLLMTSSKNLILSISPKQIVIILSIFYDGRDYETIMDSEMPHKD